MYCEFVTILILKVRYIQWWTPPRVEITEELTRDYWGLLWITRDYYGLLGITRDWNTCGLFYCNEKTMSCCAAWTPPPPPKPNPRGNNVGDTGVHRQLLLPFVPVSAVAPLCAKAFAWPQLCQQWLSQLLLPVIIVPMYCWQYRLADSDTHRLGEQLGPIKSAMHALDFPNCNV